MRNFQYTFSQKAAEFRGIGGGGGGLQLIPFLICGNWLISLFYLEVVEGTGGLYAEHLVHYNFISSYPYVV